MGESVERRRHPPAVFWLTLIVRLVSLLWRFTMQKFVLNLIVMASVVALAPTASAETEQRATASDCAGFNVRECLAEASCSFAVARCKEQARECRARTTATVTAPMPSPGAPTKTPLLPPGGAWVQNEYWPEACYIVGRQILACESDLTDAQRDALRTTPSPEPMRRPTAPAPARTAPDCTRLVNDEPPDVQAVGTQLPDHWSGSHHF